MKMVLQRQGAKKSIGWAEHVPVAQGWCVLASPPSGEDPHHNLSCAVHYGLLMVACTIHAHLLFSSDPRLRTVRMRYYLNYFFLCGPV